MRKILLFLTFASHLCLAQEITSKYELVNLGRKVNSQYHEGAPVISANGKKIFFFVTNHPENNYGKEGSQDIWYSDLGKNGEWSEAKHLGKPLNQHRSNEVFTAFPDGKTILIRGGKSKNSKGFSFSYKNGSTWSQPSELKIADLKKMNVGRFYGGTMSSDKKVLIIYMSEKENSQFSDLYLSFAQSDGTWSRPSKLGTTINTVRDEFGPSLSPDNKTMYFASSRKDKGLGKADVYRTRRLDNTWRKWSEPENVGPPVNTPDFDGYFTIDEKGNVFTTKAKRLIDGGNLDIFGLKPKPTKIKLAGVVMDSKTNDHLKARIVYTLEGKQSEPIFTEPSGGAYETILRKSGKYSFKVSADGYISTRDELEFSEIFGDTTILKDFYLKPEKVPAMLTGMVYNSKTREPIDASVQFYFRKANKKGKSDTDDGYFEFEVADKGLYQLTASAEGFLSATESVDLSKLPDPVVAEKNLYLKPIEVGTTVRLNNIFFDFDRTTLKRQSYRELNHVVDFMDENPSVEIEISGHTDGKGSDEYNLKLSQGRADAVREYIIQQGIPGNRVVSTGYGESKPEATNATEEGRAINRRVEFTILKK